MNTRIVPARSRWRGVAWAVVGILALAALPVPARADFEAGRAAFEAKDYERARRELLPEAERGDPGAMRIVGVMLLNGWGVEKNLPQAIRWLRRAADRGDSYAQRILGFAALGEWGAQDEPQEAVQWFSRCAAQGDGLCMAKLGLMTYRGEGMERNVVGGAAWIMLAATLYPSSKQFTDLHRAVFAKLSPAERDAVVPIVAGWRTRSEVPRRDPAAPGFEFGPGLSYQSVRSNHVTLLQRKGPAPAKDVDDAVPAGVRLVTVPSAGRDLKGWLLVPRRRGDEKLPAVVYFAGGFSVDKSDLPRAQRFADHGFVVMLPMLRGHNGNPGEFELFYGEVEDGAAAVRWLAAQPEVDPERIHTFGHSVGGGISALLSLWEQLPIRLGASSGGLYGEDVFYGWRWNGWVPFDPLDPIETRLRVVVGNTRFMQRPHIAYVGSDDIALRSNAEAALDEARRTGAPLAVRVMPGTHGSSLGPAIDDFVREISKP